MIDEKNQPTSYRSQLVAISRPERNGQAHG